MAIAPIDLQTLFSQVDKVGKAQVAQKDGQAIHQAIQGTQIQKKTDELIQSVNEAQDTGESDKIDDRTQKQSNKKNDGKKDNEEDIEQEDKENQAKIVLSDPRLGNKINIKY